MSKVVLPPKTTSIDLFTETIMVRNLNIWGEGQTLNKTSMAKYIG